VPHKKPEDRQRYSAEYRKAHLATILAKDKLRREGTKKQRRTKRLRETYGITDEVFNALWTAQQGLCAICTIALAFPPVRRGTTNAACIDHDHATGKLRGLLCMLCNRGLGNFKDSAEALTKAADYIVRYSPTANTAVTAYAGDTLKWTAFQQGQQRATRDAQDGEE